MSQPDASESFGWWNRPGGGKEVFQIALPLMVSTGSWSLMMFFDRMFLMWHSAEEVAAALPGGVTYWTMICLPLGLAGFMNTFVAQYHGAGRPERIGATVWQGIWFGVVMIPVFAVVSPWVSQIFVLAEHQSDILEHEQTYFRILSMGAFATVLCSSLSSFFTGRSITWVVMVIDVTSVLANVVLDYAMIFGELGFPEMGIAGAAWSTTVCTWCKPFVYLAVIFWPTNVAKFQLLTNWKPDLDLLRRMCIYGGPSGLQMLVEAMGFCYITLLIDSFGLIPGAATTVTLSLNSVAFVPLIGLSIATSTLVGQHLTRQRADLAERATNTAFVIASCYSLGFAIIYLFGADLLLLGHEFGGESADAHQIRELTRTLLRFAAVFCVFDGMQMVFAGALRGAGDTVFILATTVAIAAIGAVACSIGVNWGIYWWWTVVTAWVSSLGIAFWLRFRNGAWRRMRVIEDPEVA
jgi:MATE family multidrug resistance protein